MCMCVCVCVCVFCMHVTLCTHVYCAYMHVCVCMCTDMHVHEEFFLLFSKNMHTIIQFVFAHGMTHRLHKREGSREHSN